MWHLTPIILSLITVGFVFINTILTLVFYKISPALLNEAANDQIYDILVIWWSPQIDSLLDFLFVTLETNIIELENFLRRKNPLGTISRNLFTNVRNASSSKILSFFSSEFGQTLLQMQNYIPIISNIIGNALNQRPWSSMPKIIILEFLFRFFS